MNKFGYIINPKDAGFYRLSGGFNKIKLNLPIMKDEVMKISEIYDKNNCYMGDVLSVPQNGDDRELKEKLLYYRTKNNLDFICLGDLVRQKSAGRFHHEKLITGVMGMAYVSVMYMEKYLEMQDKKIFEAEIVLAVDDYHSITSEYLDYLSRKANFITLTGSSIPLDETLQDEIYDKHGISIGYCKDYKKLNRKWDVFINLSRNIQIKQLRNKGENGILLDPFFLISEKTTKDERYITLNNLGLYSKDIVFFNKLNIINNIYSPQLIESLARIKNMGTQIEVMNLIKQEIEENEYSFIDSSY